MLKRFFRGGKLFLLLVLYFLSGRSYSSVESDVVRNDLSRYSKPMQQKIAVKIFERRAYVYSEFGRIDLAQECLEKAAALNPEKQSYYSYLLNEYKAKNMESESELRIPVHGEEKPDV